MKQWIFDKLIRRLFRDQLSDIEESGWWEGAREAIDDPLRIRILLKTFAVSPLLKYLMKEEFKAMRHK